MTRIKIRIAHPCYLWLFVQPWMHSRYVRDPEHLPVDLQITESVFRQILLFQAEKGEVRQVTQHSLKPTVLRHDFADSRILKLVDVKRQHRDVLRRARRCDRIKNRLRKIFTEVNPGLLEFKNLRNLL